jgi:hypothetical protein
MRSDEPGPPIYYVPFDGVDPDLAVRVGAAWLREQPGSPLVLLASKNMYSRNPLLPRLTRGAHVAKPITVHGSGWSAGPVLAPWPTEEVLGCISDRLGHRATAVCILMWGDSPHQTAWLQANQATHLATGEAICNPDQQLLTPVVEVAMRHLELHVNHANGLVSSYDRDSAIVTLQHLHAAGYSYDANKLFAWALGHGFGHDEAGRLKEYAEKVQQGHRFRLRYHNMYRTDIVAIWEAEAHDTEGQPQ